MTRARGLRREERVAALAHDVGKYVARVARNVPDGGPVPAALVPLLAKDLYERPGGGRPSARFAELAADLDAPPIDRARRLLSDIDAMEADVRAGDETACVRACAAAREIEATLRALAAERSAG